LLVEDHKPLVRALKQGLEEEGFAVDVAYDGEEGDYKARSAEYDVVVLDLMLPKADGMTILQGWRRAGMKSHVLILTARGTLDDKVKGLDGGADDYLTKYALLEFLAYNRGKVVSRTKIWDHLYDEHDENTSNVVDVYIRYLRNKIDKGFDPPLILTRWGEGYMMRGEDE
jgi:DNA-binding response OmpR family regulator